MSLRPRPDLQIFTRALPSEARCRRRFTDAAVTLSAPSGALLAPLTDPVGCNPAPRRVQEAIDRLLGGEKSSARRDIQFVTEMGSAGRSIGSTRAPSRHARSCRWSPAPDTPAPTDHGCVMTVSQPFVSFLLLLGLGFFFGLAFEEFHAQGSQVRPGGVRSFPLLALSGALLYQLDTTRLLPLSAGVLVLR